MRTLPTLLTIALLCGTAISLPAGAGPPTDSAKAAPLPYEKIAKDFASAHGLGEVKPEEANYEDMLSKAFVQVKLGAFDVRFPRTDLDKRGDELKTSAQALIAAQEQWLDWLAPAGGEQKALRDDLKVLTNWVKGWKTANLKISKEHSEADLATLLHASEPVAQASQRLFDALGRGAALGPPREQVTPVRIVLTPSRREFTEFIYFVGWILPDQRGLFWLDNVPDWTQCFVLDDQVIALEYAAANRLPDDYKLGTPMDEILQQQVAQLAMNSLFLAHYAERVPGPFIGGLSMNLVIDVYGMVQTRVDGDTRSKVTGKREVFVAGGASEGGFLGKNSAETKWRENGGKDHFLGTLRAAQEEGVKVAKDVKNKAACFSIRSDNEGEKWAAVAPFFGAASATTNPPPAQFQGDFAEFYRAYKSAFIFWLQTKSQGSEKASREKFAVLLKKLADPNLAGDFDGVFKDVYEGALLSDPEVTKDTLEGKFLIWLSKQR